MNQSCLSLNLLLLRWNISTQAKKKSTSQANQTKSNTLTISLSFLTHTLLYIEISRWHRHIFLINFFVFPGNQNIELNIPKFARKKQRWETPISYFAIGLNRRFWTEEPEAGTLRWLPELRWNLTPKKQLRLRLQQIVNTPFFLPNREQRFSVPQFRFVFVTGFLCREMCLPRRQHPRRGKNKHLRTWRSTQHVTRSKRWICFYSIAGEFSFM